MCKHLDSIQFMSCILNLSIYIYFVVGRFVVLHELGNVMDFQNENVNEKIWANTALYRGY